MQEEAIASYQSQEVLFSFKVWLSVHARNYPMFSEMSPQTSQYFMSRKMFDDRKYF